jgi:hypothetical protein
MVEMSEEIKNGNTHGGELKVETRENIASEFIIQLPINL